MPLQKSPGAFSNCALVTAGTWTDFETLGANGNCSLSKPRELGTSPKTAGGGRASAGGQREVPINAAEQIRREAAFSGDTKRLMIRPWSYKLFSWLLRAFHEFSVRLRRFTLLLLFLLGPPFGIEHHKPSPTQERFRTGRAHVGRFSQRAGKFSRDVQLPDSGPLDFFERMMGKHADPHRVGGSRQRGAAPAHRRVGRCCGHGWLCG